MRDNRILGMTLTTEHQVNVNLSKDFTFIEGDVVHQLGLPDCNLKT